MPRKQNEIKRHREEKEVEGTNEKHFSIYARRRSNEKLALSLFSRRRDLDPQWIYFKNSDKGGGSTKEGKSLGMNVC